jgi:hypothetical protein
MTSILSTTENIKENDVYIIRINKEKFKETYKRYYHNKMKTDSEFRERRREFSKKQYEKNKEEKNRRDRFNYYLKKLKNFETLEEIKVKDNERYNQILELYRKYENGEDLRKSKKEKL